MCTARHRYIARHTVVAYHVRMPHVRAVEQALLTGNELDDENHTASGAIYARDGSLVLESQRSIDRTDKHHLVDPAQIDRPTVVIGRHNYASGIDTYIDEAIFAGHIMAGWGHVITETISTAWAASQLPEVPIVLAPWGRLWASSLPRSQEMLTISGWGTRPIIVTTGATAFGRVHVPERLFRLEQLLHQDGQVHQTMNLVYAHAIQAAGASLMQARRPVFAARSDGHRREHPFERELEAILQAQNVTLLRGWKMPVREQLQVIAQASVLIGFSGSNLHNSVFARKGTPIIEVQDARSLEEIALGKRPLQTPLCDLRNQPYTTIAGYVQGEPVLASRIAEQIFTNIQK